MPKLNITSNQSNPTGFSLKTGNGTYYTPDSNEVDIAKETMVKFLNDKYLSMVETTEPDDDGCMFSYPGHPGGPASGLKIAAVACDKTGCGCYRVKYPMMVLATQGAQVDVFYHRKDKSIPVEPFYRANVIYFNRELDRNFLAPYTSIAKALGTTLIFDLDDLLHRVNPENPVYYLYEPKTKRDEKGNLLPIGIEALKTLELYMQQCDGSIFSTRELQSWYKDFPTRSHVLQNGLDISLGERDWDDAKPRFDWRSFAAIQDVEFDDQTLLFGISCGSTHRVDLREIKDKILPILNSTKNTLFGIQTDAPSALQFIKSANLPLNKVVFIPPTSFHAHPRCLSAFDVALAPLENSPFNQCKSNLRLLEFGAWGVPYVASKVAPFQRFHKETEGNGGYIVEQPRDWVIHTAALLSNRELRESKGTFLKNFVRKFCDVGVTYRTLAFSIQAIQQSKNGLEVAGVIETLDKLHGIPINLKRVQPRAECPCGSHKDYRICCAPAWGPA